MRRMNKIGFTLVELMGVLVILGVLSVILVPTITNVLKDNDEKLYEIQLQNIILSAKNFGSDNMHILPIEDEPTKILTLGQLKKSGYAEKSIVNPKTKKEFSNCMVIEITRVSNSYEYTIDESTIEVENCE